MKNNTLLAFGIVATLGATAASAQDAYVETTHGTVLDVPASTYANTAANTPDILPDRSMSKAAVRQQFGPPERSFTPVGDPPITRWDYPGFRVFFEYDLVLHTVVPGDFPVISNRDQLRAAP